MKPGDHRIDIIDRNADGGLQRRRIGRHVGTFQHDGADVGIFGDELFAGLHDVLFGDNGLGAPAGPGWDTPTGLGSIDICAMQADIKNSIFSGH